MIRRDGSRALVLCTGGGIGDVLLATPVMRALRGRFGEVVALTGARHRAVLAENPDLAEVWTDDLPFGASVRRIAAGRFDVAIVTWATPRSAALPFFARVPIRVGQARRLYSGLFTRRVAVRSERGDRETHWTQVLLDYARAVGCDAADATPVFRVDDAARADGRALLRARGVAGGYVVLHATRGISAARASWPLAPFRDLARALAARDGSRVVLSGGAEDRAFTEAIARETGAISIAGEASLAAFAAIAAEARAVVAMDSGPMHVAAAVGAPTLGIFAMRCDEPDRWAPLGPRAAVVRGTYPCPPGHRKETCPDFACIAALDATRVAAALDAVAR